MFINQKIGRDPCKHEKKLKFPNFEPNYLNILIELFFELGSITVLKADKIGRGPSIIFIKKRWVQNAYVCVCVKK